MPVRVIALSGQIVTRSRSLFDFINEISEPVSIKKVNCLSHLPTEQYSILTFGFSLCT